MPFGKPLANVFGNPFNLEITTSMVANPVTGVLQFTRQFMVINISGKFPRPRKFKVLERLPAILNRIESGVEHDAVRVQMWIECAGRIVSK